MDGIGKSRPGRGRSSALGSHDGVTDWHSICQALNPVILLLAPRPDNGNLAGLDPPADGLAQAFQQSFEVRHALAQLSNFGANLCDLDAQPRNLAACRD